MVLRYIPRDKRKKIAIALFALALLFAIPPSIPFGEMLTDLFLNLPLAKWISNHAGISIIPSLVITYTLFPISLVYLGALIYPANTEKTFNGQFRKIKDFFIKYINAIKKNPIHLIWLVIAFYIMFRLFGYYETQVNIFILS